MADSDEPNNSEQAPPAPEGESGEGRQPPPDRPLDLSESGKGMVNLPTEAANPQDLQTVIDDITQAVPQDATPATPQDAAPGGLESQPADSGAPEPSDAPSEQAPPPADEPAE
jgi:hypothetical protein